MRLTLRTLLAWLDDKLEPSEVRQIGKQVAESPYAQDLIDRTYRVTRQRRLLVPSSHGPEAVDPNLVAAYLDNELAADDVTEYEKRCLTSDVNLAEVASVHQILSLIGQKAKVPPEARHRMYRLLKGRETVKNRTARDFPKPEPVQVTAPIVTWAPQAPGRRSFAERFGFVGLVASLLAVVVWTAISSLRPETSPTTVRPELKTPPVPVAQALPAATEPNSTIAGPNTKDAPKPLTDSKPVGTEPGSKLTDAKPSDGPIPFKLQKTDGLVLIWDSTKSDWSRLAEGTILKDGAQVLNLKPFWSILQADPAQVILIGETQVTVQGKDRTSGVKLGFDHGQAVLKDSGSGSTFQMSFGDKTLLITINPGTQVGIEQSWWSRPSGIPGATASPLHLFLSEGEATVQLGDARETVKGPGQLDLVEGKLQVVGNPKIPGWLTESGPSPAERQLGEGFAKLFSPNTSVLRDLVQAVDSDDKEVRRLAIFGLGAVGDAEMIVPVLNSATTDAETRRAAADVIRALIARGGTSAKTTRGEIEKVFGAEWADDTEKLFMGFTPEEARRESTYAELVRMLSAPELGTREQALRALMSLTGRDNLEYDPLKPEGRGLKAWQDLLHKKELLKTPPPAPTPEQG